MNKSLLTIVVAITAFFASCTNDEASSDGSAAQQKGVNCTITPIEYVDFDMSRSSLSLGTSGMDFAWDNDDQLTIFYSEADQTAGIYSVEQGTNNGAHARFTSVGFQLEADKRYFAISTTELKAPSGVSIPDKRNIELTYAGQVQNGNKSTTHLGKYAYMAASNIAYGNDHVDLNFEHLSLTVRVVMEGLPDDVEFTRMVMYDTENSYLQPRRTFDMTKGVSEDGKTYTPALNVVDISTAEYKTSDRFMLKLQQDESHPENGIKAGTAGVASGRLEMFMELPPANLEGKDLIFMVDGKNGSSYYIKCEGRELKAGKAYQMKGTAKVADTYTVRIKVNHDWQLGSTLDQTRATGDPGNDKEFKAPNNIYYVLCVGGKVQKVNSEDANAYTEIENIPSGNWSSSTDKSISTYTVPQTFKFTEADQEKTKNVYIVASNNDLTSLFSSINTETQESSIKSLVYSIQEENLGVGFTTQDKTQAFMKNLYSTPWTESNFVGNLGADYFKDIILYHVAAKVDLKWGSSTSVMGSTETTNKVSVNNVANENLSLFQPATKNGTTGFIDSDSSNDYTVTSLIEEDREYNGRQVYYLPQFNTYNVTVGNKAATDVTFTPATTNGFTSWMRWLKK